MEIKLESMSEQEKRILNWLDTHDITMTNPIDSIYKYFEINRKKIF